MRRGRAGAAGVWRRACQGDGEVLALLAIGCFGPWWFALVLVASRAGWGFAAAAGALSAGVSIAVYVRRRRAWDCLLYTSDAADD